jgi:hypothetical protein
METLPPHLHMDAGYNVPRASIKFISEMLTGVQVVDRWPRYISTQVQLG